MFRLKMPQTWSDTSRGFVKITVLWSPAFCRWPDFLSIMSCLCCHRQSWTYPKVFLKRPSFVGKNNAADWLLPIKTISSLSREMSRLPFLKYQFCCRHKLHWKLLDTLFKFTRVWGFWRFGVFLPQTSWRWADFIKKCPEVSLKISSGVTLLNAWQSCRFKLHHPPLRLLTWKSGYYPVMWA